MESCKRNLIYIRTSHTTTRLPFSSLAHSNRFFGFQSICFVPTAQGGDLSQAGHRGQEPEAFCQSVCFPVQLSPVPASSSPIVPLPFMNGAGGAGGQTGQGLNAVAAGRREDDSHTATLLPQCQCFCLEPFPGPPAEVAVEQRGRICSRPAARINHLSTNLSPSRPW